MESLRLGVDGFKLNGEQHVQSFSKEQMGGDAGGGVGKGGIVLLKHV